MSKFIKMEFCDNIDKIVAYIKRNREKNYYIAPKLMSLLLNSFKYRCVVGINLDSIKYSEQFKVDLVTIPVYNKLFLNDAFRIDAIRNNNMIMKMPIDTDYASVVFGLEEELQQFSCEKVIDIDEI